MEDLRGMNVGERALSGAVGGLETLGSLATVATTGLAAGVGRGLYGAATGGLEHGAEEFEAGLSAGTYEPRSTAGKVFTQGLGEGFEAVKGTARMAAGRLPEAIKHPLTSPEDLQKGPFSETARAAGEVAFEGGLFAAPFVKGATGLRARRLEKEAGEKAQRIQEAENLHNRLEAEKQQQFNEQAVQQELPGFDQLTREAEPRTPYNMPESLRTRLEAELNPPVESRVVGQPELFSKLPESAVEPRRGVAGQPARSLEYTTEGSP